MTVIHIDYSRYMDHAEVTQAFAALGHPVRLKTVIKLAAHPKGMAAGVLARELGIRQNTLSSHIATLERCGLIYGQREGRFIIYQLDRFMTRSVFDQASRWTRDGLE